MPACLRAVCFFLCAALLFFALPIPSRGDSILPSVSAKSAILIDASSGRIIYEKNAELRLPMASTTKIMTALVALEEGDPEATVEIDPRAVGIEGSSAYLVAGERLTLRELVYCLMLASANDAAAAIAYALSGGIEGFAALMNEKAVELGLSNTRFENPHGLDSKDHYTTAHDLARLTAHALKNADFAKIVATNSFVAESDTAKHTLFNHNRLLRSYRGCIGVKTGYTKISGRCLVSAAERGGLRLICVTLSAPDDWNDHKAMLDYGFAHYYAKPLCTVGESFYELPVVSGERGRVFCCAADSAYITLPSGADGEIHCVIECPRFLWKLPRNGDRLGRLLFFENGKLAATVDLVARIYKG